MSVSSFLHDLIQDWAASPEGQEAIADSRREFKDPAIVIDFPTETAFVLERSDLSLAIKDAVIGERQDEILKFVENKAPSGYVWVLAFHEQGTAVAHIAVAELS